MNEITSVLEAIKSGRSHAQADLLTLVYEELRQLASTKMAREQPGQTLQPTALVHEAWLRLGDARFDNRTHFFGAAAEAMRRILVDRARRRNAQSRGAGVEHVDANEIEIAAPTAKDEE